MIHSIDCTYRISDTVGQLIDQADNTDNYYSLSIWNQVVISPMIIPRLIRLGAG